MVSTGHVFAGSAVHAWVRFTFVVVDVTVFAAPSRVTGTFVALNQIIRYIFNVWLFCFLLQASLGGHLAIVLRVPTH